MNNCVRLALSIALAVVPCAATTITFEGLPDGTTLTNQYAGVVFTNAIVLTAGIGLNEFEFPPHSGVNVVSDNGGPITILFASPINSFSAYFTYAQTLTIKGFGASNTVLATTTSSFSNNQAISGVTGSSPNELGTLTSAAGITSVTITGNLAGGSFVMDDLTYSTAAATTPEPPSSGLLVVGGFVISLLFSARFRNSASFLLYLSFFRECRFWARRGC